MCSTYRGAQFQKIDNTCIFLCRFFGTEHLDVEELDISTIRDFYDHYKKSYDTPLCWDCALFRVLGYTEKYDAKRNG